MTKVTGIYGVAVEIFEHLMWENLEAVVYKTEEDDVYELFFREVGTIGVPYHERRILCTVDLTPSLWYDSLAEWEIDPDFIGTTDMPEELANEFINDVIIDHLHYRMDTRWEELEQAIREFEREER